MRTAVELTGTGLEPDTVIAVARHDAPVVLADAGREAMAESAEIVARLARSEEPVYGVSTGFGSLATVSIPAERRGGPPRAGGGPPAPGVGARGGGGGGRGGVRLRAPPAAAR